MKKLRLFDLKVNGIIYMVPKYMYDSYNLHTYFQREAELIKLRSEIVSKFNKK